MKDITAELKEDLLKDFPTFQENCHKFYEKELKPKDYKSLSGPFGSYAEHGFESSMFRLRLPGGRITKAQLAFLAKEIDLLNLENIHFTTGQSLQFHGLKETQVLTLFSDCFEHGIYSRGAGGDHPANLAASPLRGVDPKEALDITPYVNASANYLLELVNTLTLPRKFKVTISNGVESETHVTFKDLGFMAQPNGTFSVYGGGGMGPAIPTMGILLIDNVAPTDILCHIKAMSLLLSTNGNYKNRNKARLRFILAELGEEKFRALYLSFLEKVLAAKDAKLSFNPEDYKTTVTKTIPSEDNELSLNYRVGAQKQKGLYYVNYHPLGGTVAKETCQKLFSYLGTLEDVEVRIAPDESIYIINLTSSEAKQVLALTEDSARNTFEKSVSCIGVQYCQLGMQDSHGLLLTIINRLRQDGLDSNVLPQIHVSGCPNSCGTHQVGEIGLHGAMKLMDQKPVRSFALFVGGNENRGSENFGDKQGVLAISIIPEFFVELTKTILQDGCPNFKTWRNQSPAKFTALVKKYEELQ